MSERLFVETPEHVSVAFDIAGIGSRFAAALIDSLLQILLLLIVLVVWTFAQLALPDLANELESLITALTLLLVFVFWWGYFILFELLWSGQTPGKRLLHLRVVRSGGRPVTFFGVLIRNLLRIVDLLPALYGIGVVAMFIDKQSRRLGDLAAGTLVIKERRDVSLAALVPAAALPVTNAAAGAPRLALPNLETLPQRDYELVVEFLRRRPQMAAESQTRLAYQLAEHLRVQLGLPAGLNHLQLLEQVAHEYPISKNQPVPPGI